jgi:hypothetical protein
MGTVIVGVVLICLIGFIVRGMIKDKKSGKSQCSGDCGKCGGCH